MWDILLNAGYVIFCAGVILYYLKEAEERPQDITQRDGLMIIWSILKLLEILIRWS